MNKIFKITLLNIIIFLSLVVVLETSFKILRKIIGKNDVGWMYRPTFVTNKILEEHPCVRMETHPVFGHVPDHQGECEILGGYSNGPFVQYSKNNLDAIIILGGSTTSGFYQHYANGQTWPYLLSNSLKKQNLNYQVINGGHGGYNSSHELLQLAVNVRRLDENIKLVISLNGINDIRIDNEGNYFLHSRVNEMYESQFWINQSQYPRYLPNILSVVRYFTPEIEFKSNLGKRSKNILEKRIKMSEVERWKSNIKSMHAISESMGAKYLVFLQPTMALDGIQSKLPDDLNSEDAKMLKILLADDGVGIEGYYAGYRKILNKTFKEFKKECKLIEYCIDITNLAPPDGNNYANPRHHNEFGNKIIADSIFETIKEKLY
jgi:lysophospholipase L1-like esterase